MFAWLRKSNSANIENRSFNGIKAIQEHIDQKEQVERFVKGHTSDEPVAPTRCYADCTVGKWLHSEGGRLCKDVGLLNALHSSCEEFHEHASQAILLVKMGKSEMAKAVIQADQRFHEASERLQTNLVKLYLECQS